ncbi:MAG: coenzyme F420-0:L-glutamate ligase [Treponema sp.]|nr:coenzyme F420-0:L-glutamate ligase [Treponema sp.]MCL2237584.1 coenzyme F420-0:L-glutamate ligase [Treponema sp.]
MRVIGTRAYGLRTPIIRESDDLVSVVCQSVKDAIENEQVTINDGDIIGITEAVVARSQGNYASLDQIAADVKAQFGGMSASGETHVGVVFPILSRNRFAMLLKAIARGVDKVTVMLSYPGDEVGNQLITWDDVDDKVLNPYSDCLSEPEYRRLFGNEIKHRFTGIDYVSYYKSLGDNIDIVLCADPKRILDYTNLVIAADIHTRARTKRALETAGAKKVIGIDNILSKSVNGSGYNERYGLLGSNKATEERVKLFPRDCDDFVQMMQKALKDLSGKTVEVLVYGDGGFKDPVGGIWELADPVVSPAFTSGLKGTPNELKLKYLADNNFADLSKDDARKAIEKAIQAKAGVDQMGKMESEGTTPRQITDLLGSLCDLVSGSGDKGTPVVLIQGYFDNYAS